MEPIDDHNPIEHFQKWFYEAEQACPGDEVNTMLLSTIGLDGFPKSRIVLLKRFTWEGFIFFTNYKSEKGKSIAVHNKVSILFNWTAVKRKVHIIGKAEKIAKNLSEGYFESRPEGSKIAAWASMQSEVVSSRKILEDQFKNYESKFNNKVIPKPNHWGGYIVKPKVIEFIDTEAEGVNRHVKYILEPNYNWFRKVKYYSD